MNTLTKSPKSQEEYDAEVAEFLIEWWPRERDAIPAALATRAKKLKREAEVRTCPEWCDKREHEPGMGYWSFARKFGGQIHSRRFGDDVAMGNGRRDFVLVSTFIHSTGEVTEPTAMHIQIEEHDDYTLEQARALASAISEAADFMVTLAKA